MKQYQGNLIKMESHLQDKKVAYTLWLNHEPVEVKALINKPLTLNFTGKINCIACGKTTKKSFGQGFCYRCFTQAPEAEACVLQPQLCKAHLGIARDITYAQEHCLQPHYVYLAQTGDLKVGVTRQSQIPTRWIDQGASSAIRLCQTPNRHIAGVIETFLKQFYSDKTPWRKMVRNQVGEASQLTLEKNRALDRLPAELQRYACEDNTLFEAEYPVLQWPENPVQVNLDKTPAVEGVLKGARGQYWFLDHNRILNIRRFSGYLVDLTLR